MKRPVALRFLCTSLALLVLFTPRIPAQSELGTAQSFAVLGASTVTNTGSTMITGNVGVNPGTAITGFPPGVLTGTIHAGDAVAAQAQADALTEFNTLAGTACDVDLTGQDLGGLTLLPGVYCFSSSAQLTGALTLDAMGNAAARFVFQIGSTLTTASSSSVIVINGGSECNVFWQIGSSATLATDSTLVGNILAYASITLATSSTVSGRAIALNGAVTMDSNAVSIPSECQCTGTTAISTNIGPGCDPSEDPLLSATLPIYGSSFAINLTSSTDPFAYFILVASVGSVTPVLYQGSSCMVYVNYHDPASFFLVRADVLDGNGNWSLTLPIPPNPSLNGLGFTLQAFVHSTNATNTFCYLFSNGLYLQVGCM